MARTVTFGTSERAPTVNNVSHEGVEITEINPDRDKGNRHRGASRFSAYTISSETKHAVGTGDLDSHPTNAR